ncbi:MAG: sodium ion-translocating decarboxylase subunit beta [Thermodesulfobacteriota bacterium]
MIENLLFGFKGLWMGFAAITPQAVIMIIVGAVLIYLGVKKGFEPLLLLPIGFGCILVNIPLTGLMGQDGLLRHFYDFGIATEIFPCLIFVGIGAMTDFTPLLENPRIFLLGAAGQFGIFLTLLLALLLGFQPLEAVAVGIIGACDGPTSIFVTSRYAPHLLGQVSVAAYSYMALVPLIQPPIMRLLTSSRERAIPMRTTKPTVSKTALIIFPLAVTVITCIVAPMGTPLMGMIMLGNLMKESGVVKRLTDASANELTNIVTLLLGLTIGATMDGQAFLTPKTLLVLALGFLAICLDTAAGVMFGKILSWLSKGQVNPLIGAAGISAYPMSARVVQSEGSKYNKRSYLLMPAMAANTSGQIGSVMAAAIMLSVLQVMNLIK